MDAFVGPGVEVIKCAGPPILRQIRYCFHYKKNVENLRRRVEDLSNTKTELQARVVVAENNLESIKKPVLDWFERVDKETTQDETILRLMNDEATIEMINQQCCQGWCCCRARWKIGRDAQKKIASIDELINEGKSFVDVSYPSPPVGAVFAPTNEDFEDFESRKSSKDQIIAALKDDKTSLVGVYGMGGVGKTMLVNQVHKLVMEEKLFDVVAITTVSENADLKCMQNEIGKQLGLKKLEETDNISKRAEMLRQRLMRPNQKFLVILDDLWTTELGLSDVGIPYRENCCKVVITTRSIDVCNSLGSHKNIEVGVLTEEESWLLFKKNVGEDVVNSPALQKVARDVANECGKLPIALVTIGRALKNKDKTVWIDTANQLKNYDFSIMGPINSKVFKSIKLSYDHLGNEILKKCFLFCCLFPEDYRISIDELMMHVIGDCEILKNMAGSTLKQVRGRLHTMLDKLMASCLLFGHKEVNGRISKVWMHDIVRYVALSIVSEEGSGFFAEVGLGLKDWPESLRLLPRSNTSKYLRVSLMRNEISVLPDQPEVPNHLLCLSLEGNRSLHKIPDIFFQKVETLATLNLSETGISSLPSSLSCLRNLRSLHLGKCDLHEIDVSVIGKLKKLEILNLSRCKLSSLPEEIGELSNLKLLDLSENRQLNFILPNVISRLSRLEELYMLDSFKRWKLEPTGDGTSASLDEVSSLKCVQLHIENDEIKASISIGCGSRNQSYLSAPSPICHSIRVLLARVDDLKLSKCTGLKSVGQLVIGAGFINMKSLVVKGCSEMEYLTSVVEEKIPTTTVFIALETLRLYRLDNLKEIFQGPMPAGLLDKLKLVRLHQCKNLVSIFSFNVWVKLKNLEVLRVGKCRKLKEVFYLKEEEGNVDNTFPRLKEMFLGSLPELTTIWKGVIPIESLRKLKVMEVERCNGLRYLFSTPAMALALQELEELMISDCYGMTAIVAPAKEMVDHDGKALLPKLRNLLLENLPYLKIIWKGNIPIGSLENLRKVKIHNCSDNLKHLIFPVSVVLGGGLSQLEILEIKECEGLQAIIDDGISPTADEGDQQLLHKQLKRCILLPRLSRMFLIGLPNLMTIAKGVIMSFGSFENLEKLSVTRCNSLKHLLPMRLLVNGGLPKLKEIWVTGCNEMEVIFNDDRDDNDHGKMEPSAVTFPHLKEVVLQFLPKLSSFHQGPPILDWPSLQTLTVCRCENLKRLPLNHHHSLPELEEIGEIVKDGLMKSWNGKMKISSHAYDPYSVILIMKKDD